MFRCIAPPALLLLLTLLGSLIACSGGDGRLDDTGKSIIYISGHYNDVACYWKDDGESITRVDLPSPGAISYSRAVDLSVLEGDVIVAGYYFTGAPPYWVLAWKNGQIMTSLGNGIPSSLYAGPGRVLVVAQDTQAFYWDNGQFIDLTWGEMGSSSGHSIIMHNGNVYATTFRSTSGGINYHINGGPPAFLPGSSLYQASRIRFSGETRCIAGRTGGGPRNVSYWTGDNGPVLLTSASQNSAAHTLGLHIYKGDVYVASEENNQACYWINNAAGRVLLPAPGISYATAIRVIGGSVFVSGRYGSGPYVPCYWRDGKRIDLEGPSTAADATGIFVATQ